ncbi:MAG TPA: efflux RND transporter periplasmic adaptor subunit [Candidatus Methylomirabilis sp.]|nr:efflux RND transporter periplasmic adaptor subunit [Candidatus Methylomirabilis sp.]
MENQNIPATGAKKLSSDLKRKIIIGGVLLAFIFAAAGLTYWLIIQGRVYIDKAEISAAVTDLSPNNPGTLAEVLVNPGDYVVEDQAVARVGNETIKAKSGGIIVSVNNDIGKNFNKGEVVASMIDPTDLRVVGHVQETKGLKNIQIGQRAIFTVDAFGGQKFYGVVDEISDTSRQSGIVFNISDKREVREFDVKVRFDINAYPELKNGMSAKLWIYKK